jgi:hypothetical protein
VLSAVIGFSASRLGGSPDAEFLDLVETRSMDAFTLRDGWLRALDSAAKAVEAAAHAHSLTLADCTAELRTLKADREWLNYFDWRHA